MKLTEAEMRMVFQIESTNQNAALNEIYMTWRYAPNPATKETAEGLLDKLRPLSDQECMDLIRKVQAEYRLPEKARTIGEMLAEARQKSGAQKLSGHDIMALERFDPATRHMIVFDVLTRNEWGDMDESGEEWDGRSLLDYEDGILSALVWNRMPEEAERGLMHWYGKEDNLDAKVRSAVFTVEARDGVLWGVAECQVLDTLSPQELNGLKDYIEGQASDGWGEEFEQREIQVEGGELYVHLWQSEGWSILVLCTVHPTENGTAHYITQAGPEI